MKYILDIPDKVIAHIRSDYGHGYKYLRDEDKDILINLICNSKTLDDELNEIREELLIACDPTSSGKPCFDCSFNSLEDCCKLQTILDKHITVKKKLKNPNE
jgi:hypothetical protein